MRNALDILLSGTPYVRAVLLVGLLVTGCDEIWVAKDKEADLYPPPPLIPYRSDDKWGYCTPKKKKIRIPLQYEGAEPFSEGLAAVKQNGKWGFIDSLGQWVVYPKYDLVGSFSEGLAWVCVSCPENQESLKKTSCKCGFINQKGKEVIPLKYESAGDFSEGFAVVERNGKYGYINRKGVEIVRPILTLAKKFSEGLGAVALIPKGLYVIPRFESGYVNSQGKLTILGVNRLCGSYSEGVASILSEEEVKFIDRDGKVLWESSAYKGVIPFSEGLAGVQNKSDKIGFIDKTWQEVIPCQYDDAGKFSQGVAPVKKGKKWGFINRKGQTVIRFKYDSALSFSNGLAFVKKGEKEFYIDRQGTEYYAGISW